MKTEKRIGKIKHATFGLGGYQDCQLGLHITLGSDKAAWGCGDSKAFWDSTIIAWDESKEWDERFRDGKYASIMRYVSDLLYKANVESIDKLTGIPVECEFEGDVLKDWRILQEAI